MLEKVDLTKKMSKEEYKEKMETLELELGHLQRECKEQKIPVMIAFEGYGASGKGLQIGRLIQGLDPRGFEVHAVKKETEEERMHPFMWRFWTKTPERGRIAIYDTSWYRRVQIDRFDGKVSEEELPADYESIRSFEKQLTDDGMVIVKLFLAIDQKEQKKRFKKLMESKETKWRVSEGDLKRNKEFARYEQMNEEMLRKTDTDYAPWTIIEATDKRYATAKIFTTVIHAMQMALEKVKMPEEAQEERRSGGEREFQESLLAKADLSKKLSKKQYKEQLKELQGKMERLHGELYRRRIPVVLGFEGWDAGGKGGAIKRLTEHMDPRGYVVNPTASPNDIEKAHH